MNNIKIGDTVQVTNTGKTYSTYAEKAEELNARNYLKLALPETNYHYKVSNIGVDVENESLALIEDSNTSFIVGCSGLKVVKKANELEELKQKHIEMGEAIKRLEEKEKSFDFREWMKTDEFLKDDPSIYFVRSRFNIFEGFDDSIGFFGHYYHMQAGIVIEQHFKRIIGTWEPDWSDNNDKVEIFYSHAGKKIKYFTIIEAQSMPNFMHVPVGKRTEILEEISRMKTLYGFDIVKYYLTGEA